MFIDYTCALQITSMYKKTSQLRIHLTIVYCHRPLQLFHLSFTQYGKSYEVLYIELRSNNRLICKDTLDNYVYKTYRLVCFIDFYHVHRTNDFFIVYFYDLLFLLWKLNSFLYIQEMNLCTWMLESKVYQFCFGCWEDHYRICIWQHVVWVIYDWAWTKNF